MKQLSVKHMWRFFCFEHWRHSCCVSIKLLPAINALRPILPAGTADISGWGGPGTTVDAERASGASHTGAATFCTFKIGSSFSAHAFYSRAFFDLEVVEWPSYARYVNSPKKLCSWITWSVGVKSYSVYCYPLTASPEVGVLDKPYSSKSAQRSSHTCPPGYKVWTRSQPM
jgi:hypothetical protein